MRQNRKITLPELAAKIGVTLKGVEYHVRILKRNGTLERVGPNKGGHWKIVADDG